MTEETQTDPPWKAALRRTLTDANYIAGTRSVLTTAVLAAVLPHMETSYRTGRMAGASASAKRLAQKNLELSKKLREVREALFPVGEKCCSCVRAAFAVLGDGP